MFKKQIPRGVVVLGLVSMCMDISSEMVHSLLPVFMTGVLGVSALAVGVVEGIAESTASIVKIFSGAVSDWLGKRKPLLLLGYGLATVTRPLFPLAQSLDAVLVARFTDRIGKGIRGAPRDALMADITPADMRGSAYGLRQSMDTIGAFMGPLISILLMLATMNDFRFVFAAAIIPAALAVLVIVFGVKEPEIAKLQEKKIFPLRRDQLALMPLSFWTIVVLGAVLTMARFSDAFLVLRAHDAGLGAAFLPVVFIIMNMVYTLFSWPAGIVADRIGKKTVLLSGIGMLIVADVVLSQADDIRMVFVGAVLWGAHMGLTQGILTAFVADQAPPHLRGTAFGIYHFVTGIALFFASLLAGLLWTEFSAHVTFEAGAAFAAIALAGFVFMPARYR